MKFLKKINKFSIIVLAIAFMLGLGGIVGAWTLYTNPALVPLGTTSSFAILAGSGITNSVSPTTITGDIGTYATTSETGFTGSDTIIGIDHAGDSVTQLAKTDLTTAYNNAAARSPDFTLASAELGTMTLGQGVYNSAPGDFQISSAVGSLTLDGGGNPNAVFIFKAASTLKTIGASSVVNLINGAQACNVFWQVGTEATLGTTSNFKGTIMADQSITDAGGSTVVGRLLARIAHVTVNNTTLTVPTCAPSLLLQKAIAGGGPDLNTAWTLKADGALGSPTNLSGITGATGANSDLQFPNATFKADTYTITETGPTTNYVATYSCANVNNGITTTTTSSSITLVAGDKATCTITNTYTAPTTATLTLVKTRTNDNGGTAAATDWTLRAVGPTTTIFGSTASVAVTNAVVNTGTYTLSEDSGGPAGYAASTYSCVKNGAGAVVSNSINLIAGDTATCTINNNDIAAHLIVIKHVVNDNGGSALASSFSTIITGVTTATPTAAGVESPGIDNILTSVGAYSIDEGAHIGYNKTLSADCSGTITLGQTNICTIINTYIDPVSSGGGGGTVYGCKDPTATNYNAFSASNPALCVYANISVVTPSVVIPLLPKTGFPPQTWYGFLLNSFLNLFR